MTNKYIKKLVVILSTPAHTQYVSTYSVRQYILSILVSIVESSADGAVAIPSADDPFDDDDTNDNTNYDDTTTTTTTPTPPTSIKP